MTSQWSELVDAAVVGAGRAAAPQPAGPLASLRLSDAQDGAGLLAAAAAASRARRAGFRPPDMQARTAPEPADPDGRRTVGVAARRRLAELLAAGSTELLVEWVSVLGEGGMRPPDAHLPALLTAATYSESLRDALLPVLGPLAAWLAAANPAWSWAGAAPAASGGVAAAGPPDMDTWTTQSHRARRELLELARQTDPAAARELVAATWASDSHRDRAAFIAGLATGLGPDDEELLERAMKDTRGEVRRAAADLLARLPASRFAGRATERAASAVQVQRTITGRHLVVTPPADITDEMAGDCITGSPPAGTGRQAWVLQQIVAVAPASWWVQYAGLSPAQLLSMSTRTEWGAALRAGWSDAAIRDADAPWLAAFLDSPGAAPGVSEASLLSALPAAARDGWLRQHPDSVRFATLEEIPAPWSAALSEVVRSKIAAIVSADPGRSVESRRLLRLAALRLNPPAIAVLARGDEPSGPPAVAPDEAQIHPRLLESWASLLATLSVRAAIRRELAEEPAS
jgi:hypothetical protein